MKTTRNLNLISMTESTNDYVRSVATHKLKLLAGEYLFDYNEGLMFYDGIANGSLAFAEREIIRRVIDIPHVISVAVDSLSVSDRKLKAYVMLQLDNNESVKVNI